MHISIALLGISFGVPSKAALLPGSPRGKGFSLKVIICKRTNDYAIEKDKKHTQNNRSPGPVICTSLPLVGTGDALSAYQAESSSPAMKMDGA